MTMTIEQAQETLTALKGYVKKYESKIEGFAKDMNKAIKAGDFNQVRFFNKMIAKYLENIQETTGQIADCNHELNNAQAIANEGEGFSIVIDFLEEMYESDIVWHKGLKELTYKELKKETKSTQLIAGLSESEAKKLFRKDIQVRFYKLVTSVKKKAGDHILQINLERNDNGGLDGIVKGNEATVRLETIIAGGYNIQRAHYRTLVK